MKINANFLKYRSHFERVVRPAGIELSSKSLYFWVIDISCGVDISPFISLFMKGLILLRCNVDAGSDPK